MPRNGLFYEKYRNANTGMNNAVITYCKIENKVAMLYLLMRV
jgi:hypothetical protein